MAITISNLRIIPYSQKDQFKAIFGDELDFEFALPTPHQEGDKYALGLDFDKVVYPPSRPLCAYSTAFEVSGDVLKMTLALNTARFRDWVCRLKKPTPISLQLVRIRKGVADTLLLDDILALPSVVDGTNTVCPGDPLAELLDAKMDKPYAAGDPGQILSLDENGQNVWRDEQEIPEQEQADWDESDSTAVTYIKNKPDLDIYVEKVEGKGLSTNDFTDADKEKLGGIEDGAQVNVQADYDESDSAADAYIRHKPVISAVGHTGDYNDLLNKPNLSVYSLITETGNKIAMSIDEEYDLVVSLLDKDDNVLSTQDVDLPIESMIVDATYANGVLTLTLQNGNTVDVDISDIVSGLVPDSRKINGHSLDADVTITASDLNLATVATSGSYDDLLDKPHIPVDPVQADYDESDSTALDYIKNKPVISEVGHTGEYNDLLNRPHIPVDPVQADWDESDSNALDYIKNKPAIPAAQVQADYDESDSTDVSYIKNKPALAAVATTGSYNSLANKPNIPYNTGDYLTIWSDTTAAGVTVVLEKVGSPRDNTFQYCTNGSTDLWQDYTLGTTITLAQYGYVRFRNKNAWQLLGSGTGANYYHFTITGNVWITGDITSLKDRMLSYDCNVGQADFCYLFKDNTGIKDASGMTLPSTRVANYSYMGMFDGCTGLEYGPAELPATTLGQQCYRFMFRNCSSLKLAPKLPATTLASMCYHYMFGGCTSLTEAPELPASTVPSIAYNFMFANCTSLKHVKAAATALGTDYAQNWLYGVSTTGVIECPSALDLSARGADTAPAGWTVIRTDAPWSDWDESDSTEASYIKNKPAIPSGGGGADSTDYLCVQVYSTESIKIVANGSPAAVNIEYSFDKSTWMPYTIGTNIKPPTSFGKVYFRGDNATFSTSSSNYYQFGGFPYNISGSACSLLKSSGFDWIDIPNYAFYKLFSNIGTQNKDGNAHNANPYIKAGVIGQNALNSMFENCRALNGFGDLKFERVKQNSLSSMFKGCENMITPPRISPLISVDFNISLSTNSMFEGCSSLVRGIDAIYYAYDGGISTARMYYGCSSLDEATFHLMKRDLAGYQGDFADCFYGCDKLTKLTIFDYESYSSPMSEVISVPDNTIIISNKAKSAFVNSPNATVITTGSSVLSDMLETDQHSIQYVKNRNTSVVAASSDAAYTVEAGSPSTGVLTVASALTLNADNTVSSTAIAYAEVVIDLSASATVTAGTNLTLVDTPTAGKRNVCVVRWQGGTARLYVVDVMDIPA